MAADRIIEKIFADAEAEAKMIAAAADEEIEALRTETAERATQIERDATDDARGEAREEKRRILSRAQAEMRKELLEEKQKLIDQTFGKALTSLVEQDENGYMTLMRKLLTESIESGDEEMILAAQDRERNWASLLEEVNRDVSARGLKGALTLSGETRDMKGGFVLRRGRKEINCALELIVGSLREELESEVAEALFPNDGSQGM